MKMIFDAPDYSFPGQINFDQILFTACRARAMRLERRIESFLLRTGLSIRDTTLVQLRNGETYPQWSGAIALLPREYDFAD
jgi:hypothetical protein